MGAHELHDLASNGYDVNAEEAILTMGRMKPPSFRKVPLVAKRMDDGGQRCPGGYSQAARLWVTLRAMINRITKAEQRGNHNLVSKIKADMLELAAGTTKGAKGAWADVQEAADDLAGRLAVCRVRARSAGLEEWAAAAEMFMRLEAEEVKRTRARACRNWHAWVARAITGGAGPAHRWTNMDNAAKADVTAPNSFSLDAAVQYHTEKWGDVWSASEAEQCRAAVESVSKLRKEVLRDPLTNAERARQAAKSFKKNTTIGIDGQEFDAIVRASEHSREHLAAICRKAVETLAWPLHVLLVIMSLLGKKSGGSRTVAIIATFARLVLAMMRDEVRQWDADIGSEGDTALGGRRPMDETARRHLRLELAGLCGEHAVILLWDMAMC